MRNLRMVTTIAVFSTAIVLSGCATKDTPVKEEQTEEALLSDEVLHPTETSNNSVEKAFDPKHEFDDITEEMIATLPDPETMTEEEFLSLSVEQFRAFVSVYIPDYRSLYAVNTDTEFTETEWNSLKALVNYRIFGHLSYAIPSDTVSDNSIDNVPTVSGNSLESVSEDEMQDAIKEDIDANATDETSNSMSVEEIDELIIALQSSSDEELLAFMQSLFSEEASVSDISNLTEEEIEECRQALISECQRAKETMSE